MTFLAPFSALVLVLLLTLAAFASLATDFLRFIAKLVTSKVAMRRQSAFVYLLMEIFSSQVLLSAPLIVKPSLLDCFSQTQILTSVHLHLALSGSLLFKVNA